MKNKFQNKYRIPSARATWHDYNEGMYFITICTTGMEHYFGKIEEYDMLLNTLGEFVSLAIRDVSTHYPYAEITVSQIMPNHFHLIVIIDDPKILREVPIEMERIVDVERTVKKGRASSLRQIQQCDESEPQALNLKMKTISNKNGMYRWY